MDKKVCSFNKNYGNCSNLSKISTKTNKNDHVTDEEMSMPKSKIQENNSKSSKSEENNWKINKNLENNSKTS